MARKKKKQTISTNSLLILIGGALIVLTSILSKNIVGDQIFNPIHYIFPILNFVWVWLIAYGIISNYKFSKNKKILYSFLLAIAIGALFYLLVTLLAPKKNHIVMELTKDGLRQVS